MSNVTVFGGPSCYGLPSSLLRRRGQWMRPPARHGDIGRLVARAPRPGVAVLCDGVFKSALAVSHAELCDALDAGWKVWGVSSLGAIRAHEMRTEGMRGYGYAFAQFARYDDFTDDEFCLLHLPGPGYEPLTEALVNIRFALEQRADAFGIDAAQQRALIAELRGWWFGDRTPERINSLMTRRLGVAPDSSRALLLWTAAHRVKSIDLQGLLSDRPWEAGTDS